MAAEFDRILAMARGKVDVTLQAALQADMGKLIGQVEGVMGQFDAIHVEVLRQLRVQAGLVGREVVAADVVKATMARYRWTRFKSMLIAELGSAGRLIDAGVDLATEEGSGTGVREPEPAGAAATP